MHYLKLIGCTYLIIMIKYGHLPPQSRGRPLFPWRWFVLTWLFKLWCGPGGMVPFSLSKIYGFCTDSIVESPQQSTTTRTHQNNNNNNTSTTGSNTDNSGQYSGCTLVRARRRGYLPHGEKQLDVCDADSNGGRSK